MKNGWRIILIIAAAAILLGCVCFGVGVLTGADSSAASAVSAASSEAAAG